MKIFHKFATLVCLALMVAGPVLAQGSSTSDPLAAQTAVASKSYHVVLNYANDEVSLKEINLTDAPPPGRALQPAIGWRCDVIASGGEVLDSFLFDIPMTTCSDAPGKDGTLSGGCSSTSKSNFAIDAPYYENGIGLNIVRPDGKNYYINTIGFARLCGDNICESNENYATCSQDCRSGVKDGFCDRVADGVCDPDCFIMSDHGTSEDPDCKATFYAPSPAVAWWVVGGLAVILVAGIFIARKKK